MANTIKLKRGSGSDPGSSDLAVGELAVRTDTALLFTKNDGGSVVPIGISDGDKGDITVSSNGGTFTIDSGVISTAKIADDAVTFGKITNIAQNRIVGRISSGTGAVEDLTAANVRTILGLATSATTDTTNADNIGSGTLAAARVATLNQNTTGSAATLGTSRNFSLTGEVTASDTGFDGSADCDIATTIANNVVDEANLKVSNSPTNGYVLTARSGNTGGMTWEEASGGGATGGSSDKIFQENGQTVTANYTIGDTLGAACNAMSAGPITVNSGVTVTIGSGENWIIL